MQLSRRGNRNVKAASFCLPALMFRVSTGGQSQAAFLFASNDAARTPAEPELVRRLRASGVRQLFCFLPVTKSLSAHGAVNPKGGNRKQVVPEGQSLKRSGFVV